ncbi:NUDIX domain-containing protein [Halorubrum ejinorense]|uniref:NUDIX domain-containing protein n=1 Tax=Halorubrum ejinorense TaxID=425309 RepID=A0AAV3SVH2_9EURY
MDVHDEYIPEELFSQFISRMPQICVELIFESEEGILVAKRDIEPSIWFWPGSRLYKGEKLEDAAHRIAEEELGIEVHIIDQYGPYAHFWTDSPTRGSPSRHTVNSVFHVEPARAEYDIVLDEQHSQYRFLTEVEDDLHEYVRLYLEDNDLL